jgi:hypothetical protein
VRPGAVAVATAALALAGAPAAVAAPAVTNTDDSGPGSLRAAVDGAAPGDTINVPPGTYVLTSGQLNLDSGDLALVADPRSARVQAAGAFRVMCISGASDVDIAGLVISDGRAAPSAACADGQGGGIHDTGTGSLSITDSVIERNTAGSGQGGGGGIFKEVGNLEIRDSTVHGNRSTAGSGADSGGGGVRWTGSGFPNFVIRDSTFSANSAAVSGASSGGGAIYSAGPPDLEYVTVSANSVSGGGGGGLFARNGGGSVDHVTFFGNTGAGAIASGAAANDVVLTNSALTHDSVPACGPGAVDGQGGNVEHSSTCGLGAGDKPNTEPELGPLALNGSQNGTATHEILRRASPAVEAADPGCGQDQRGVGEFGNNCDAGAYEYDGRASADVPDCSPTGRIPITLDEPPGGDVEGMLYTVNGGGVQQLDTPPTNGPISTALGFGEGRHRLEYWGEWTNGIEAGHNLQDVLVDKTRPRVTVMNPAPFRVFVIKRRVSVRVAAADALSGLTSDPSGTRQIATGRRGAQRFAPTAVDLCRNAASAPFDYRVLAPKLGVRTVLERVRGSVKVGRSSGASASQKGRAFTGLRVPRELSVRSLVDARRGTARITSSRDARSAIQDGEFVGGVFQVLQSRRAKARGLTELRLKGGGFGRCRGRSGKAEASARRRVIRRLRANTRGRFRTRGRHSSATVRGTVFTVEDRCDGTLTKVKRGKVAVRDFRRRKTIIVRAGKRYLARASR